MTTFMVVVGSAAATHEYEGFAPRRSRRFATETYYRIYPPQHTTAQVLGRVAFVVARRGRLSHCVCGHPEEAHLFGGRCRAPGCVCDRFWPIPEAVALAYRNSASSPCVLERTDRPAECR